MAPDARLTLNSRCIFLFGGYSRGIFGPRFKGILAVAGMTEKYVFQGVHMVFDGEPAAAWAPDEPRQSKMIFIGKNLDKQLLQAGFHSCLARPD